MTTPDPYGRWAELLADPVAVVIPPPEVRARPARDGEIPKTAEQLATLARANGWIVFVTYARGPKLHATYGTVTRIVDSIAVRMRRGTRFALAFWVAGKFDTAQAWTIGEAPIELGAEEIKNHVRTERTRP